MRATSLKLILALSLLGAVFSASPVTAAEAASTPALAGPLTPKGVAFQDAMRSLWEEHIMWTRLYIVDFTAGSPETDATTQRLLQNQVDIGDAIKPYYGDAAGEQLTALLRAHILTAADVLAAAKAGDTAKLADASQRWYANGDEIAAFLNSANPENWPLAEAQMMMKSHLDDTLAEAVAHLQGDWNADIAAYDTVQQQILGMADMLSIGIINQFPQQFS
jgi:hypothetical protein